MNISMKKLTAKDVHSQIEIDNSFYVDSLLVLSLIENQLTYTIKEIQGYEKSYSEEITDYHEYIDNPHKIIYLAHINEHIIGQIVLKKNWNGLAYIEDITVDKKWRKLGVGKKLLSQAKRWAQENEMAEIMLETQNNNVAACKFYESCGFILGGFDFLVYKGIQPTNNEIALYWYLHF
jgi:streptothricin acetyltransferase